MTIRLKDALKVFGPDFLVISAAKPDKTEAENEERNKELEQTLIDLGYTPEHATGHYTYEDGAAVYENSFVVHSLPEKSRHLLGRQFDQESILDEHGLHFLQKGTTVPFKPNGHYIDDAAKQQPSWIEYPLQSGAIALALDFEAEK